MPPFPQGEKKGGSMPPACAARKSDIDPGNPLQEHDGDFVIDRPPYGGYLFRRDLVRSLTADENDLVADANVPKALKAAVTAWIGFAPSKK